MMKPINGLLEDMVSDREGGDATFEYIRVVGNDDGAKFNELPTRPSALVVAFRCDVLHISTKEREGGVPVHLDVWTTAGVQAIRDVCDWVLKNRTLIGDAVD